MKNEKDVKKMEQKRDLNGLLKIFKDKGEREEIRLLALRSIQNFSESSIMAFR